MIKKIRLLAAAAFTAICMTSPGLAATVTVNYETPGNVFGTGSQNAPQMVSITSPSKTARLPVGAFHMTSASPLGNFTAFCVDVGQYIRSGQTYNYAPNLFSGAVLNNLDKLFTSAYATVNTAIKGAAFQIAIWEIIADSNTKFNLGRGAFTAGKNSGVIIQARSYLQGLTTAGTGGYKLTFLQNNTNQDLVTATPSPIPLPAAGLMLAIALGALGGLRKFRKS